MHPFYEFSIPIILTIINHQQLTLYVKWISSYLKKLIQITFQRKNYIRIYHFPTPHNSPNQKKEKKKRAPFIERRRPPPIKRTTLRYRGIDRHTHISIDTITRDEWSLHCLLKRVILASDASTGDIFASANAARRVTFLRQQKYDSLEGTESRILDAHQENRSRGLCLSPKRNRSRVGWNGRERGIQRRWGIGIGCAMMMEIFVGGSGRQGFLREIFMGCEW